MTGQEIFNVVGGALLTLLGWLGWSGNCKWRCCGYDHIGAALARLINKG